MIIRCPECSTGFRLPDERVTPDGTKLKCSHCEHVFRVREDDAGEVEIFYRSHDNKEPAAAAAKGGDNPFPHAGLDLKPKASSAFGGDDGADTDSEPEFDDEEASELQDVVEEPDDDDVGVQDGLEEPDDDSVGLGEESSEETSEAVTGSGSQFGDPADHVDESFGESGPVFDPEKGKVTPDGGDDDGGGDKEAPSPKKSKNRGGRPPAGAVGPPPTQMASSGPAATSPSAADQTTATKTAAPAEQSDPTPQPASSPEQWDDDDLEPHNIGGSTGQKVVTFLLLVAVVGAGFIGTVAALNDGFIDFKAFDEMLEVAFSDGEYEPRPEWTESGPEVTVVENTEPVAVEGVYGEVVEVGQGEQILVVQGIVRNHDDSRLDDVDLRGIITTVEGRSLREIVSPMTPEAASIGAFRDLESLDDVDELLGGRSAGVDPGDAMSFTMVFDDVPQRVVDGDRFSYRVEIVE